MFKKMTLFVLIIFIFQTLSPSVSMAQTLVGTAPLPEPGSMIQPSTAPFIPAHIQALTVNPTNPFNFTFLINKGDVEMSPEEKESTYSELIKYFLTSLTIPDENQWVNLSPYEGDRLIEHSFGMTHMGRELLAQDYLLKQLTASLLHPDLETGKRFWEQVYQKSYETYGTTEIPFDTFNKVWIVPDEAVVLEQETTAYLISQRLRVFTEKDYIAMKEEQNQISPVQRTPLDPSQEEIAELSSDVMKEVIIPILEKEVNESQTFAGLRQITTAMILATWYKKTLKESVLGQKYANQSKTDGVNQDPANNEIIYQQYIKAFQKGVFNMIREDMDLYSQEIIPRKYFSGGVNRDTSQTAYYPSHLKQIPLAVFQSIKKILFQFDEQRFDNVNAQVVSFLQETQNARSYLTVERSHRDSMNGFLSNSFESHHPTQEAAKEAFKALIQTEHPDEDITNWEKWWDVEQNDKGEWGPIPSLQWFKENFSFLKNPSVYDSTEYNSWVEGLLNINRQFQYPINLKIPYKKLLEIGLRWAEKEKEKIYITVRTISTSTYGIEQKASRDSLKPSNIKGATLLDIKQSLQNTQLLSPEEIQDIVNGYFNVLINPSESFFPALMTVPVEIINPKTTTINQEEGKSPEVSDPASKTERYGGIDLNAVNLNLQIKRDGNGFLMPITIEDLESFQIDGLVPEIISIEPATYLPFLNTILE